MSREKLLTDIDINDVVGKANALLANCNKVNSIIKEDIFNLLEMNCKTLYYPIENDEICGFVYSFKKYKFVYINSYILLEKQVFAAAHELYHILYSTIENGELLNSEILDEKKSQTKINVEDLKANRFAAEVLVPEYVFKNELRIRNIMKNKVSLENIVQLMDIFLVPYKTIVRRLYEINYIDEKNYKTLLLNEDRNKNKDVMLWQKRLGVCRRNNERTKNIKLDKLVDMSLKLYEKRQITYEKLEYLLSLSKLTPKEFDIYQERVDLPSEDEIIKMMED